MLLRNSTYNLQFVVNRSLPSLYRLTAAARVARYSEGLGRRFVTAASSMGQHESPNVEAAAAALTEAEALHASDLQLPWWSKLRWRQTSKSEAAHAEKSMLTKLVKYVLSLQACLSHQPSDLDYAVHAWMHSALSESACWLSSLPDSQCSWGSCSTAQL